MTLSRQALKAVAAPIPLGTPTAQLLAVSRTLSSLRLNVALPSRYRSIHASSHRFDIPQWPNPPVPQPSVTPYDSGNSGGSNLDGKRPGKGSVYAELAASPIVQAAVTTAIGLIAV